MIPLVVLSLLDWATTFVAIKYLGAVELNPLLASWITTPVGFFFKLAVPLVIGWRLRKAGMLKYVLAFYVLVVAWNTGQIVIGLTHG